jgi:DNA polymerase III delta prime subunit
MLQSYLIIGNPEPRREKTLKLFKSHASKFSKNSPDITIVCPAKNTTTIDQVRQVRGQINQRPVSLPYKYVIFEQAETLNKEAQNALLKTLEEPPASAIIILEASDKSTLLPTILSRVALIWAEKSETTSAQKPFTDLDTESLLEEIGGIENPKDWLDQQMVVLFKKLEDGLSGKAESDFSKLTAALENCKEAKKMIDANVNPKFVLANLALNNLI